MKEQLSWSWFIRSLLKSFFIIVILPVVLLVFGFVFSGCGRIYELTEVEEYGKYIGNYDNDTPTEFIESFFPPQIKDTYSDISYRYKVVRGDTYAYEAYLEFQIKDAAEFYDTLEAFVNQNNVVVFPYDNSFMEYTIDDELQLSIRSMQERTCTIQYANFGKILYSIDDQRFVFVAIGMLDGGGADTIQLGHFFSRFNIDPRDYASSIDWFIP